MKLKSMIPNSRKKRIYGVVFLSALLLVAFAGVFNAQRVRQIEIEQARRSASASEYRNLSGAPLFSPQIHREATPDFNKNKKTAAAIFAGATRAEGFRLKKNGSEAALGQINGFPYFAKSPIENKDFAARLGDFVLDSKSYVVPGRSVKSCYFEPSINFRVWKNEKFVDTMICFQCSQLAILERDPKVPMRQLGGALQGRFHVAGDFVEQPPLLALAREVFPDF